MSNTKMTPPFGVRGYWELKSPYQVRTTSEYQCIAIRNFAELAITGIDTYNEFYAPHQLSKSIYESDNKQMANIVTLSDETGELVHVPDTYIAKYPDVQNDQFKRVVLSIDLGPLPMGTKVTHISKAVKDAVDTHLGRSSIVRMHLAPLTGNPLSPSEMSRQEANRTTTAKKNVTPANKYANLNAKYGQLQAYTRTLELRVKQTNDSTKRELAALKQQVTTLEHNNTVKDTKIGEVELRNQTLNSTNRQLAEEISELKRKVVALGGTI